MNKSDVQETLFTLFLRLNGYFLTGYISHAPLHRGNRTEIDTLAVRFPYHSEPCLNILPCPALKVPANAVDCLICEVKGGNGRINFNAAFREDERSIRDALCRIGVFKPNDVEGVIPQIVTLLYPTTLRNQAGFPTIPFYKGRVQLRFILVAAEQEREGKSDCPYLYGDDLIQDIWKHFRPETSRVECDTRYNRDLWGEEYKTLVKYFKDRERQAPGSLEDIYEYHASKGTLKLDRWPII